MPVITADPTGKLWQLSVTENGETVWTAVEGVAPSSTATTVQDIANRVIQDTQNRIGPDHPALVDYVNRTHEALLRAVQWAWLVSPIQTFTTVEGKTDYWFGAQGAGPASAVETGLNILDLLRIEEDSVYDRTGNCQLFRVHEKPLGEQFNQNSHPHVWRNDSQTPYVLNLYPSPNQATHTIQFRYRVPRNVLTTLTDAIQIPKEYEDVLVAGVNERVASAILHDDSLTLYWRDLYNSGKRDMIRDMHPWGENYIQPDPQGAKGSYVNAVDLPLFVD